MPAFGMSFSMPAILNSRNQPEFPKPNQPPTTPNRETAGKATVDNLFIDSQDFLNVWYSINNRLSFVSGELNGGEQVNNWRGDSASRYFRTDTLAYHMYETELNFGTVQYEIRVGVIVVAWFGGFGWMRINDPSCYTNDVKTITQDELEAVNRVLDIVFSANMDMDYS